MVQVVRVLQHDFMITREYTAGHVITEEEAAALTQLLVENVRNNVTGWVTREAKGRAALTREQHDELTLRINKYANAYIFKTRFRAKAVSPFISAVEELARQHAEAWGTDQGLAPESQEVAAKFIELKSHVEIHDAARELILHRQSVVLGALDLQEIL